MDTIVTYNVPHMVVPWGILIVIHFFLSGLAGGSYLASAIATYIGGERYRRTANIGAYMALLAIVVDVPVLIMDLDRPERFFTLLFRWSATAPLTWGVWFLVGLGLFSIFNILLQRGNNAAGNARSFILCIGSIIAIGVCTYTAVAVNIATDARPIWSNGIVIPIFLAASGITAISVISLLIAYGGEGRDELHCLSSANAVLLALQLIMVISLVITASVGTAMSREAAGIILKGDLAILFWVGIVIAGLLVPIFLLWANTFAAGKEGRINPGVAVLASLLILIGIFSLRYIIVYGGQIQPLT